VVSGYGNGVVYPGLERGKGSADFARIAKLLTRKEIPRRGRSTHADERGARTQSCRAGFEMRLEPFQRATKVGARKGSEPSVCSGGDFLVGTYHGCSFLRPVFDIFVISKNGIALAIVSLTSQRADFRTCLALSRME